MQKKHLKLTVIKLDPESAWPHDVLSNMPEFKESAEDVNNKLTSGLGDTAFNAKRTIKSQTQTEMEIHWYFSDLDSADPNNLSDYFSEKMYILSIGDLADSEKTVGNPPRIEHYNKYTSKLLELSGQMGVFVRDYQIVYDEQS